MLSNLGSAPNHGGSASEMLRDLADFLDKLDAAALRVKFVDGPLQGRTLAYALRGDSENGNEMQSDVRWLADQLAQLDGEET